MSNGRSRFVLEYVPGIFFNPVDLGGGGNLMMRPFWPWSPWLGPPWSAESAAAAASAALFMLSLSNLGNAKADGNAARMLAQTRNVARMLKEVD